MNILKALQVTRETLAAALLGTNPERDWRDSGICRLVAQALYREDLGVSDTAYVINKLTDWFVDWPQFSGSEAYPVPNLHTPGENEAAHAFYAAGDMWSGPYGELRKDLARFLVERLDEAMLVLHE